MQSWQREVMKMFKVKSEKVVKYDLQISEDLVEFLQWMFHDEQDDTFKDAYTIVDFLGDVANKAPHFAIRNNEINITYYK